MLFIIGCFVQDIVETGTESIENVLLVEVGFIFTVYNNLFVTTV